MAAAVTRAKKIYTTRKNLLARLLDPIPQLTQDRGVGMDRLMDYRKGCKAAWEQFALAHDELVQVRPEEDDPDAEEFGALENRKNELVGTLAKAIGSLNVERLSQDKRAKEERAQQDRQAELESQHQQKVQQVVVRRLHLANLHTQAKEYLDRLRVDLHLHKAPSAEELRCVSMGWQTRGPP